MTDTYWNEMLTISPNACSYADLRSHNSSNLGVPAHPELSSSSPPALALKFQYSLQVHLPIMMLTAEHLGVWFYQGWCGVVLVYEWAYLLVSLRMTASPIKISLKWVTNMDNENTNSQEMQEIGMVLQFGSPEGRRRRIIQQWTYSPRPSTIKSQVCWRICNVISSRHELISLRRHQEEAQHIGGVSCDRSERSKTCMRKLEQWWGFHREWIHAQCLAAINLVFFLSLIIIHRDTCGHGPLSRKGIIFFSFFSLIIAVRPTDAAILLRAWYYIPTWNLACLSVNGGESNWYVYICWRSLGKLEETIERTLLPKLSLEVVVDFYNYPVVNFLSE